MELNLRPENECKYDALSLGEVMLRLDPGEGRIRTARSFRAWEGGGEYNVVRGLRRCFGMNGRTVIQIIGNHGAVFFGGFNGCKNCLAGLFRQCRIDSAGMKPPGSQSSENTACLGFEIEGNDKNLKELNLEGYKKMINHAAETYPNFKVVATTLREVKTATVNDWSAICWADGEIYKASSFPIITSTYLAISLFTS